MTERTWLSTPALSPTDHGFTVGDGAFETCKVVDGVPEHLDRHHNRLDRSLAILGMPAADRAVLDEGIAAVLAEPLALGRLRYTVTSGPGPSGTRRGPAMTYAVSAGPMELPSGEVRAVVVPWPRNERSAIVGAKCTAYAENVVARRFAAERGGDEAIFANSRGELCEGATTNVFVVRDGIVRTPPLDSGALPGITRALVMEAAAGAIVQEAMPIEVVREADEVFVTSALRGVAAVVSIDGRSLAAGPVTARMVQLLAGNSTTGLSR